MEYIFTTMVIDAYGGHYVVNFVVPGTYFHTKLPNYKYALLELRGESVDIMCDSNPRHIKNVIYENEKKGIYLQVL